jgi:aminoglycoside phosphotransferase (APT) family kinase protein
MIIHDSSDEDGYDSDEYPELQPNFPALRARIVSNLHSNIFSWTKLTRGRYHEIYLLHSSKEKNYIARFSRFAESPTKLQSEIATMRYIRAHTSIPVPAVYLYDIDTSPKNDVGLQFIIMEQMEGQHLYNIWDDLSTEHQKVVLSEIAKVLAQLDPSYTR